MRSENMIAMYTSAAAWVKYACVALIFLMGTSACTRHYAKAVTSAKPASAAPVPATAPTPEQPATTLKDSLVGTWRLRTVALDNAIDKMTTFGSQKERDDMTDKLKQFQDALAGLTTTFKGDMSYKSVYGGQSDEGEWTVNRQRDIQTVATASGNISNYHLQSISGNTITVKYEMSDAQLILTFARQ